MYEQYPNVPEHIRESIHNYVEYGHDPGSFLRAVIQRDLMSCIEYADDACLSSLRDIVRIVVNHTPHACWGSVLNYANWRGNKAIETLENRSKVLDFKKDAE